MLISFRHIVAISTALAHATITALPGFDHSRRDPPPPHRPTDTPDATTPAPPYTNRKASHIHRSPKNCHQPDASAIRECVSRVGKCLEVPFHEPSLIFADPSVLNELLIFSLSLPTDSGCRRVEPRLGVWRLSCGLYIRRSNPLRTTVSLVS